MVCSCHVVLLFMISIPICVVVSLFIFISIYTEWFKCVVCFFGFILVFIQRNITCKYIFTCLVYKAISKVSIFFF